MKSFDLDIRNSNVKQHLYTCFEIFQRHNVAKGVFIHEHLVMTSLPAREQIACVNAFRKCLAPD